MTGTLDALRPWSVNRVAAALDLHPFEVIRLLAAEGGLPATLRLDPADVARVIDAGGLEVWWADAEAGERLSAAAMVRALAIQLLERGIVEPSWTRADNVYRGLGPRAQGTARRALNTWIRGGVAATRMAPRGLELTIRPEGVEELRALAGGAAGSYAGLLEDA